MLVCVCVFVYARVHKYVHVCICMSTMKFGTLLDQDSDAAGLCLHIT